MQLVKEMMGCDIGNTCEACENAMISHRSGMTHGGKEHVLRNYQQVESVDTIYCMFKWLEKI